jgi:hypothetical protein
LPLFGQGDLGSLADEESEQWVLLLVGKIGVCPACREVDCPSER